MEERPAKICLLTGPPSCGKTTAVFRLVGRLGDLRLAGFYTRELREQGARVGFDTVGLSGGRHVLLAHVRSQSRCRVGRYGVEPAAFAPLVVAELVRPSGGVDLFVVDEVGRMEMHCDQFVGAVRRLLDGPVPVVATVAAKGGGLIAEAKARPDARLGRVTEANRDRLPAELEAWVRRLVSPGGTGPRPAS